MPRTTVTGSTTTITAPTRAAMVSSGRLGTKVFGLSSSHRSDAKARAPTTSCAPARNRSGSPIREPDEIEDDRAKGDPDQEDPQDHREHVRGVARARREQARPGDLVPKRRHARDEGDEERQPRAVRHARPSGRTERARRIGPIGEGSPCRRARSTATSPAMPGARGPDHERPGQAEQLDEHEARGQRPEDCADRVRRVEPPEGEAEMRVTGEVPGEDRQRGAHQHGGRRQGEERQPEPHQCEELWRWTRGSGRCRGTPRR